DLSGNFHDLNDNKICNNELDLRLGNTVETINAAQNKLDSIENEGNVELTNEHYRSCEDENQEEQLENTQITQCETFTDNSGTGPFEYTLENDIQLDMDEDGWACLHLVGRITLDCQGHTIRGYQQEGREGYLGTAITLGDRHNLGPYNIINCNIENVGTGIESNKAGSLIIRNTKIENADVRAIDVRETQFTIQESSITNSKKGLYVEFSPVANIFYNNFTNNMENGIFLNGNDATRVSHNNFCNNALEPYLNRPAFDITCVNSDRTFAENNAFSSSDVENCGNMQQAVVACE
ncbi:MAG: right-handed parallel beta-helix repeat-containing protein, partial [Candidatus Marinimicrobia bacterium]|nr:right-handed parallel beta-helix repeat-containing protein [Candidatus Neomarinimicrobiota bacterium]